MERLANVLINMPGNRELRAFTYTVPEHLSHIGPGWRVLVPFGPRLALRLRAYLEQREHQGWPCTGSAPLFSWDGQQPISTNTIRNTFRDDLLPQLALTVPAGTYGPRVHGLRHTFAVRTLLRWYREGIAPASRLNHLATFLGHVNPASTAVYLTITSDLFQEANRRFEGFAPVPPAVEVQP